MAGVELVEVEVPEGKPAWEWVLGEPVQKVSPQRRHGILQLAFGARLGAWAASRGQVATEWRFRLAPPGEARRPLVPDVAYLSFERMRGQADLETPTVAPDIVVEILSPDDRAARVAHKRDVYLACGVLLLIIVDPSSRSVTAYEAGGAITTTSQTFAPERFPGLVFPLPEMFAASDPPVAIT